MQTARKTKPTDASEAEAAPAGREAREKRHRELTYLLNAVQVAGASPSELKFRNFEYTHAARRPSKDQSVALGLLEEDSFRSWYECKPKLFLEAIADHLRSEPECSALPGFVSPIGSHVVERFQRNLAKGKHPLLAGLLTLGLPAATAHDWLRGLLDDGARRSHLGCFLEERCLLFLRGHLGYDTDKRRALPDAPATSKQAYRVTRVALFGAYSQWCTEYPGRLDAERPYSEREFSAEILKCGGVTPWRTKRARGFSGIALR